MRDTRAALIPVAASILAAGPALAQAHHPFSVGLSEGGGAPSGVMGWIMSQQGAFEHAIAAAIRGLQSGGDAALLLLGLSFAYGVLHAAGPGHGKAVLASYMLAGRRALRRGVVLSFAAALVQAAVAILLVGALSLLLHATAATMRETAILIEKASYGAVACLGAWLVWRKGGAFLAACRSGGRSPLLQASFIPSSRMPVLAGAASGLRTGSLAAWTVPNGTVPNGAALNAAALTRDGRDRSRAPAFTCDEAHEHGPGCGHVHAPDPSTLGEDFSWRTSAATVAAAGARPCSGAILVLVFASSQGAFAVGVAATLAMALGTAITTAALASLAVLAKSVAVRLAGAGSARAAAAVRGFELLAALLVLGVGLSLLLGVGPLQSLA